MNEMIMALFSTVVASAMVGVLGAFVYATYSLAGLWLAIPVVMCMVLSVIFFYNAGK